jgi:hypothetical protein
MPKKAPISHHPQPQTLAIAIALITMSNVYQEQHQQGHCSSEANHLIHQEKWYPTALMMLSLDRFNNQAPLTAYSPIVGELCVVCKGVASHSLALLKMHELLKLLGTVDVPPQAKVHNARVVDVNWLWLSGKSSSFRRNIIALYWLRCWLDHEADGVYENVSTFVLRQDIGWSNW